MQIEASPESLATPIHPSISPDGRWLLSATQDGRIAIRAFDRARFRAVGHRHRIRLTGLGPFGLPTVSWAPDSRQLVLAGTIRGKNGVWIMRRDGTHLRRVVCGCRIEVDGNVDWDEMPAWSARGGIAFVGSLANQPASNLAVSIFVVRADGTALRRITTPKPKPLGEGLGSFIEDTGPAWSPDGRKLVYAHDAIDGHGQLRIVDPGSHVDRSLPTTGASATWSPDGDRIAYIGDDSESVQVIDADGAHRRNLQVADSGGFLVDLDWRIQ